jgi:hypothetical protein
MTGRFLAQAAVPVLEGDTEATLAARVLEQEHRIYPAALGWLAAGMVRVEGGIARVAGAAAEGALASPLPVLRRLPTSAPDT